MIIQKAESAKYIRKEGQKSVRGAYADEINFKARAQVSFMDEPWVWEDEYDLGM